jgi:sugar phosphate isomerase/epimerase
MKLGVLTVPLYDRSAEDAFAWLRERGVETVELGTGGYNGSDHCDPFLLLQYPDKLCELKKLLNKYHLQISGLSCHSNHVHPNKAVRDAAARTYTATLQLAESLNVDTVISFSGCPGDCPEAKYPNWVTCDWPPDFREILKYQWDEILIPFWRDAAKEAERYGVQKIALELHPGFCVYNTETLMKLRGAVGDSIGANVDPSHLFWQGMRPKEVIKELKGAIYHFHAKDTHIDCANTFINGVLDTKDMEAFAEKRSWLFRTVGYGHGASEWNEILSALRFAGYDGAISIEHEDVLMSTEEGLQKAIDFLSPIIIREKGGEVHRQSAEDCAPSPAD